MALINCPDSDKEMSKDARECPHCGKRLTSKVT